MPKLTYPCAIISSSVMYWDSFGKAGYQICQMLFCFLVDTNVNKNMKVEELLQVTAHPANFTWDIISNTHSKILPKLGALTPLSSRPPITLKFTV